jgi:tetratricopeptide (TPR) repeat protein
MPTLNGERLRELAYCLMVGIISMNESQFEELLHRQEGDTLDFKATGYSLIDEKGKTALITDVLAMANTPRSVTSSIVFGVKKYTDNSFDLIGLTAHPDEADLQSQFSSKRVYPIPQFTYEVVTYNGKQFGLIQIPPVTTAGPYMLTAVGKHTLYFRRGSKNDVAQLPSDWSRILSFFNGQIRPDLAYAASDEPWRRLITELDQFSADRYYMFVVSPVSRDPSVELAALGSIPWVGVIDFDPNSDAEGVLNPAKSVLAKRRSLHMVTGSDHPTLNLRTGTYWFFARGLSGRLDTLAVGPWKAWRGTSSARLGEYLKRMASACAPTPVSFLILWNDDSLLEHLNSTLELLLEHFGSMEAEAKMIVVTSHSSGLKSLSDKFAIPVIEMPTHHLCSGLSTIFKPIENARPEDCRFPTSSGSDLTLSEQQRAWLLEELDLVDLSVGLKSPPDREIGRDFLRGAEVSWYDLALDYDIKRDITDKLNKQVRVELDRRRTARVNLYHAPGAGGTTVGKRLLWDFHRGYPTVILRRTNPRETAERLSLLTSLTGQSMLVLVDGATVAEAQVDELYDLLRSRNVPVVILQILRRFHRQTDTSRASYLEAELSSYEAERFAHVYAREEPDRKRVLDELLVGPEKRFRSVFYFGLVTFQQDFLGLERFVGDRIADLTFDQLRAICYLALAHHYGQRPLPAQTFAGFYGIPESRLVDLRAVLPDRTLDLLVEAERRIWRTSHDLIATEVLEQVLSGSSDRRLWRQNLSSWAIDFAELCRGTSSSPSDDLLELTRRTFIYRDNTELLGTERSGTRQFSQLVQDIPSLEGKARLLGSLVDLYPGEAHFWAHLGRFYSVEMHDYDRALECIDRAIALDPGDSVLHHMKGMTLRHRLYDTIDKGEPVLTAIDLAQKASGSFAEARNSNPGDEHGYISEAQMLTRLIDYVGRQHRDGAIAYLASPQAHPFLRESFERAEDLLERVRRNREGGSQSQYEQDCRASLDTLHGHYDRALQLLDNLLAKPDVFKPPVRRHIVWTLLARRNRSWNAINNKEADRIVILLEDNLREEPNSDSNLRLWVQAVRRATHPPTLDAVIEKLAYWRAASNSVDASFYLYVMYALQAIDGSVLARESVRQWLDESRTKSRTLRTRTKSYEWLGSGKGLGRLIHHSELGEWEQDREFFENTAVLTRVVGRIVSIDAPQAGKIEIEGGIEAFFVPARGNYRKGDAENRAVSCFLGFSYDGPRAWQVTDV